MESKNLNQFYSEMMADVANNPSLLEDLESSNDFESLFAKLSKLGREKGYNFSDRELRDALDSGINLQQDRELNDELLAGVAGGGTDDDGFGDGESTDDWDGDGKSDGAWV